MRFVLLILLFLCLGRTTPAQGIYTQVKAVNPAGWHIFPASALSQLPAIYEFVAKGPHPRGELVTIRTVVGRTILADDVLIDRNGRQGARNLSVDKLVMSVDQAAALPLDIQTVLAPVERLPNQQIGRITVRGR